MAQLCHSEAERYVRYQPVSSTDRRDTFLETRSWTGRTVVLNANSDRLSIFRTFLPNFPDGSFLKSQRLC